MERMSQQLCQTTQQPTNNLLNNNASVAFLLSETIGEAFNFKTNSENLINFKHPNDTKM